MFFSPFSAFLRCFQIFFLSVLTHRPAATGSSFWGGQVMKLTCSSVTVGEAGGTVPHNAFHQKIFADLQGRDARKKKWRWRRKKGKLWKGRWKIENGRGKTIKIKAPFFLTFWNHWNLCGSTKMGISTRKKNFMPGKNQEKWLCPPPKYSSDTTAHKIEWL